MIRLLVLLAILAVAALADLYTTLRALRGGGAGELQPFIRWLISGLGLVAGLLVAKGLMLALLAFASMRLVALGHPTLAMACLLIALALHVWAVRHNLATRAYRRAPSLGLPFGL